MYSLYLFVVSTESAQDELDQFCAFMGLGGAEDLIPHCAEKLLPDSIWFDGLI
jgi:hypothetical protein